MEKKEKGHQETCMKNTGTKSNGGEIEGGRWVGWGGVGGKWRQLYLTNNNNICLADWGSSSTAVRLRTTSPLS